MVVHRKLIRTFYRCMLKNSSFILLTTGRAFHQDKKAHGIKAECDVKISEMLV